MHARPIIESEGICIMILFDFLIRDPDSPAEVIFCNEK